MKEAIEEAEAMYVSGATPGQSTSLADATVRLLEGCDRRGVLTAFGLFYHPGQWDPREACDTLTELFPAVDVFVADEDDMATVLDRDAGAAEVAQGLATNWEFETVAVVHEDTTVA